MDYNKAYSKQVYIGNKNHNISQVIKSVKELEEKINLSTDGQYGHTVIIKSGNATINNAELDCEFTINFDDNTEADEADVTIYNLSNSTINQFKRNNLITITAGYGKDTGIIFSGYITTTKSHWEDADRVTEVHAVDDLKRVNKEVESISYSANKKASYILKDLCKRVGLPIAVFKTRRDYTYTDEVSVDGSLSDAIVQYAKVCGVSAYVCKSKIYVRPLKDGDNTRFTLSSDTGLLSVSEFEEESSSEEFKDVIKGFDIECLLQHRMQTASIIDLKSQNYNGTFRVREGSHEYDGTNFITKIKVITI